MAVDVAPQLDEARRVAADAAAIRRATSPAGAPGPPRGGELEQAVTTRMATICRWVIVRTLRSRRRDGHPAMVTPVVIPPP